MLAPAVASRVLRHTRAEEPVLSAREIEVLELVARGRTNREAAAFDRGLLTPGSRG